MTTNTRRHILREFGTSNSWKHIIATSFQPRAILGYFAGKAAFKSGVVVKITCEICEVPFK